MVMSTPSVALSELILPAPAKLNLFLHITGRRSDGYHLLQTVFQFLDYADEITLSLRNDGEIVRLTDVPGVPAQQDLMVKAAQLLKMHTGVNKGIDISINKKLPMGGGLGGGSSDAATILLGLNTLWQCHLSEDELATLGLQLGADVPVFVRGQSAWAEGVGENIQAIDIPEPWYLVVRPDVNISTAKLFSDKRLTRDCEPIRIPHFLAGAGGNVFEPIARNHYPDVDDAMHWLSQYGKAKLTGTGSCIFAEFSDEKNAKNALDQLPGQWSGFIAKGINISPLKKMLSHV
jgi:4-diphosphocytidyl-2-C-methyl-D-erythritol kinase